eukprot:PhF_6_TR1038/c0_g1_i1/m.2119
MIWEHLYEQGKQQIRATKHTSDADLRRQREDRIVQQQEKDLTFRPHTRSSHSPVKLSRERLDELSVPKDTTKYTTHQPEYELRECTFAPQLDDSTHTSVLRPRRSPRQSRERINELATPKDPPPVRIQNSPPPPTHTTIISTIKPRRVDDVPPVTRPSASRSPRPTPRRNYDLVAQAPRSPRRSHSEAVVVPVQFPTGAKGSLSVEHIGPDDTVDLVCGKIAVLMGIPDRKSIQAVCVKPARAVIIDTKIPFSNYVGNIEFSVVVNTRTNSGSPPPEARLTSPSPYIPRRSESTRSGLSKSPRRMNQSQVNSTGTNSVRKSPGRTEVVKPSKGAEGGGLIVDSYMNRNQGTLSVPLPSRPPIVQASPIKAPVSPNRCQSMPSTAVPPPATVTSPSLIVDSVSPRRHEETSSTTLTSPKKEQVLTSPVLSPKIPKSVSFVRKQQEEPEVSEIEKIPEPSVAPDAQPPAPASPKAEVQLTSNPVSPRDLHSSPSLKNQTEGMPSAHGENTTEQPSSKTGTLPPQPTSKPSSTVTSPDSSFVKSNSSNSDRQLLAKKPKKDSKEPIQKVIVKPLPVRPQPLKRKIASPKPQKQKQKSEELPTTPKSVEKIRETSTPKRKSSSPRKPIPVDVNEEDLKPHESKPVRVISFVACGACPAPVNDPLLFDTQSLMSDETHSTTSTSSHLIIERYDKPSFLQRAKSATTSNKHNKEQTQASQHPTANVSNPHVHDMSQVLTISQPTWCTACLQQIEERVAVKCSTCIEVRHAKCV